MILNALSFWNNQKNTSSFCLRSRENFKNFVRSHLGVFLCSTVWGLQNCSRTFSVLHFGTRFLWMFFLCYLFLESIFAVPNSYLCAKSSGADCFKQSKLYRRAEIFSSNFLPPAVALSVFPWFRKVICHLKTMVCVCAVYFIKQIFNCEMICDFWPIRKWNFFLYLLGKRWFRLRQWIKFHSLPDDLRWTNIALLYLVCDKVL